MTILFVLAACTSAPPPTPAPTPTPATQTPATTDSQPTTTPAGSAVPTPAGSFEPSPEPSATAATLDSELITPGVLEVCLALVGAPAASIGDDTQPEGYNAAIASGIAARLGLTAQMEQPLFQELLDTIAAHDCDISVSSQNITASRLERVAMIPYSESQQPILVGIGNPENIDSLESLCGLAVSTTSGTTHADLVEGTGDYVGDGLNDLCRVAGEPSIDLRTFETELLAVTQLVEGEVAAYLGNPGFKDQFPDFIQYAYAALPAARQGIAVALDRPLLLAAVESALDDMIADGTYRQILVDHLPNDESVDIVSIAD